MSRPEAASGAAGPPEVARLDFDQLSVALRDALRPRVERLGYLGEFFRIAGHQPDALLGFVEFTEALKAALPPRLTEVIALTVSAWSGNDYERHQHERLSLALGFGEDWVRSVLALTPDQSELTEQERAIQALTLASLQRLGRDVGAEMARAAAAVGTETLVPALLTVGRYLAHAVFVNAWGLAPPVPSPLDGP